MTQEQDTENVLILRRKVLLEYEIKLQSMIADNLMRTHAGNAPAYDGTAIYSLLNELETMFDVYKLP